MRPVLVLGASGMLGQGVLSALKGYEGHIQASVRRGESVPGFPDVETLMFDASAQDIRSLTAVIKPGTLIVNCIGIIKPYIHDENQFEREVATRINGLFPYDLARFAESEGHEVVQIATDCVYSGLRGLYSESDDFDALDVYGKSKSLGEVPSPSMMHIRVSIIGPEIGRSTSLFEWVRNQPTNAVIGGFTDHLWNGVTTYHFGKLARGVAESNGFKAGTYHLIPGDIVTKETLVRLIANMVNRDDLTIDPRESGKSINRTLVTNFVDISSRLWNCAGYVRAPSVQEMISELGQLLEAN